MCTKNIRKENSRLIVPIWLHSATRYVASCQKPWFNAQAPRALMASLEQGDSVMWYSLGYWQNTDMYSLGCLIPLSIFFLLKYNYTMALTLWNRAHLRGSGKVITWVSLSQWRLSISHRLCNEPPNWFPWQNTKGFITRCVGALSWTSSKRLSSKIPGSWLEGGGLAG